jgi:hypothetical protein
MNQLAKLLLLGVLASYSVAVSAAERCPSVNSRLVEVKSILALPAEIGSALGASRVGLEGIADRGQSFNKTDVVDSSLPMRRFSIAGASENCILVAVERGGRGYSVEIIWFERASAAWQRSDALNLESPPLSLSELIASIPR